MQMSQKQSNPINPSDEFRDILLYSAVPVYTLFIAFGVIVGESAVGAVFMIMILLGQYAIKKTQVRCNITFNELVKSGLYRGALLPIAIMSVMHYLTNVLFAGLNNPASSVLAFALCYLMLFLNVQTHAWFAYLYQRRQAKESTIENKKKDRK